MALSYSSGAVLAATGQPTSGTVAVTPNAASKVGDIIMVLVANADTSGSDWTMPSPWSRIMASASAGSGKFFVFTKPFETGDSSYTLTRTGSDGWKITSLTISGADTAAAPVIGTIGTRAASGGTNTTTAPSITTPGANYTALYLAMERTNAVDTAPTVNNGFSVVLDVHNISGDSNPNAILVAEKAMPTAGAVGATTATFTNTHATNSNAFLFALAEKAGGGGTPAPTVVAGATGRNAGSSTITLGLPSGIANGDLLVVAYLAGNASAYTTDHIAKGWWNYTGGAVNTRTWNIVARIYNSSTPVENYTLTQNVSAFSRWVSVAIRNHGVAASTDIQTGATWKRADNGGSQGKIIAPSITTSGANRLVLALTGEASSATGTYSVTTANGFTLVSDGAEDGSAIEWVTAWQKSLASAGAAGDLEINWASTPSLNGIGVQLSIPPAAAGPAPATGRIGGHAITFAGENVLNVGAAKLNGSAISVVLYNSAGTQEIQRKTMSIDSTTQWGNVQFTGLTADTVYTAKFEVDGTVQTDVGIVRAKTKKVAGTPLTFTAVGGSCQLTASNNPIYRAMADKNPEFIAHMGDLHYADPTTDSAWRTAVNSSLTASNFQYMLQRVPFIWTWDNHDRIILDAGASASPLNMGYTDPATNTQWRTFNGQADHLASNAGGRAWIVGRVLFVQTDQWTNKDDPDAVAEPRTFLGAAQKQAFKEILQLANDSPNIALVVWWSSWTTLNNGNGRWGSFNAETTELENWIDARPVLKKKMVLIGGDSHSLQADSGTRTGSQYRFKGIPSLNVSGFNRSSTGGGDGSAGWDIANGSLINAGIPEQGWGGYSHLSITDNGKELRFRWEARRVHQLTSTTYDEDTVAFFERSYGTDVQNAYMGDTQVKFVSQGTTRLWTREEKGSAYTPGSTA
ncbi:phosphatase [Microbacterium phage PauloDiaboli]|nr:phosphatase [Microbacterium phage PauloDiaboli]